jgi:hypothetical protein
LLWRNFDVSGKKYQDFSTKPDTWRSARSAWAAASARARNELRALELHNASYLRIARVITYWRGWS